MTEYFLVNKDIKMKGKEGWLEVTSKQLESAARTKKKHISVVKNIDDAKVIALDNDHETRFFPIYRVEIDESITGGEAVITLSTDEEIEALEFATDDLKVTDAYLDHIDESYKNVSLAPRSEKANDDNKKEQESKAEEKATPVKSRFSQYIPSAKNAVKNGLPLASTGAALYVGAPAIASTLLTAGITVPAALMASPFILPVAIGVAARLAVEVPELALKLGQAIVNGGSKVIDAAKSRWAKKPEVKADQKDKESIKALTSHLSSTAKESIEVATGKTLLSAFNLHSTPAATALVKPELTHNHKARNTPCF
ncbi:hypothetical protein [Candidatus Berkiella aquae]|uniref:Uncharacterized protein n=1 Tax=Candidatus Berkiella aquae TaxID=295108 RepID=A0A0Q9YTP6_9GAMM|nr:hypothetical protein [Candidatus Berkiella aquae]MCS5711242.1 hypothetical protein [Candidatus Berkiella aquae]